MISRSARSRSEADEFGFTTGLRGTALGTRGAVVHRFLKDYDIEILRGGLATYGDDFEVNFAGVAVGLDADALFADGLVFFLGLNQGFAEIYQQALASHFRKAEGGLSRGGFQVGTGLTAELDDFEGVVDHHTGRHEAIDEQPVYFLLDGNT